jgi:hypothetical protein
MNTSADDICRSCDMSSIQVYDGLCPLCERRGGMLYETKTPPNTPERQTTYDRTTEAAERFLRIQRLRDQFARAQPVQEVLTADA